MRLVAAVAILTGLLGSHAFGAAPTACGLIPAAEMSALLGSPVSAVADDRSGQTTCTYSTAGEELGAPYAEVELSWGDGAAGMAGAGIVQPQVGAVMGELAGLGDQAVYAGPMILIRRKDDLISIVVSGVPDGTGAAKRIYGLLDQRLPKAAAP